MENRLLPRASQGTKLRDKLKMKKSNSSYTDIQSEVIINIVNDIPPTPSGNHHKQQVGRKTTVNKEVVKYISTLPNYLERGENLQEKAFNVGVLDWRRLENWQHNLKQVHDRSSRYSPSSSNTSSSFSTDGSSIHSSGGHSLSPACQRMHQPTLQSHLNASPEESYSQGVKTIADVGKIQDLKAASTDPLKGKQSNLRICQSIDEKHSEIKLKECKRSDPQIVSRIRTSLDSENYTVASHLKGKMKIQEVESTRGMEKLPEPYYNIIDHNCPQRDNTVVLLLPRDDTENSHSTISCSSDSTAINGQQSSEANQRSFQEVSFSEEISNAEVFHDTPHSCFLPREVGNFKNLKMKETSSTDVKSVKCSHEPSQSSPSSVRLSSSPSRGKNMEEKSNIMSTHLTLMKSSEESNLKMGTVAAAKVRNPSPTRLFSIGLGKNGRSSGPKDGSAASQLSSRHISAKSGSEKAVAPRSDNSNSDMQNGSSRAWSSPSRLPSSPSRGKNLEEKSSKITYTNSTIVKSSEELGLKFGTVAAAKVRNPSPTRLSSIGMGRNGGSRHISAKSGSEKAVAPPCSDNSIDNLQNGNSRAKRSSPLRRLLDPLLKTKAANSHDTAEPSWKDSSSAGRACNSSDGRVESSTLHSMKVKFDLRSCRTINVDDSHHNDRHGSSTVQALLQIAIKNGCPLFTFAVDNNILAATMRKLSTSKKDDNSWIYTFFTIREVKKKNGCMNQGSKGKGQGYVPNVVAQLKVSDSQFSKLIGPNSTEQFSIREFVLFAVDPRESDQQTSDFQPNDELAAIIVKFPAQTAKNLDQDGQQSDSFNYQSMIDLKEPLPEVRSYSNSRDNKENGSSNGSQDPFSTTVLLPGGTHGLPSKGEQPSSLIERWKSGGLCDCGGWDMGCRIRVFSNQIRLSRRRSSSSIAHPTEGLFELFAQGEELDNRPAFSLSTFKDGLFSVEFNSSLSLLQAFSICISVLNSRKAYKFPESSNLFGEKSSEETTFSEIDGTKGS